MTCRESVAAELEPSGFPAPSLKPGEGDASDFARMGASPEWRRLKMQADMVAPHLRVAAIEGEDGVGKLTLARYLHAQSPLARREFQRYDAREWLASGGDRLLPGEFVYLEHADQVTPSGQALLLGILKAMQDQMANHAVLVASSASSLRQMAARGLLMADLAFRLTAVRLAIPPLRQRPEDIAPLAQILLERICARYRHRPVTIAPAARARLLQHNWPGNVRELECVLEAALLEMDEGVIRPGDLPISLNPDAKENTYAVVDPEPLNLEEVIRRHVGRVLDLNRGNKVRAARQLGISRSTLYRLLDHQPRD